MPMSRAAPVIFAAILTTGLLSSCGQEPEESSRISVRFNDGLPTAHYLSENFSQVFVAKSEAWAREHGHSLQVEHFPDGQLGDFPDQIDNMNNGAFDVGLVASAYNTDQMPASDVFNLPNMADDSATLTKAYYSIIRDSDSTIYQRDFGENTMVPLATAVAPTYQLALTTEISGPESIKNKRIRSSGGVQNDVVSALGGIPVSMSAAEQYESLERGVLDGGVFNTPSMIDNGTGEVLASFTPNADTGSFSAALTISDASWSQLPDWAKSSLIAGGKAATAEFARSTDALGIEAAQTLEKDFDLKPARLSQGELASMEEDLDRVTEDWAASGDGFDAAAALAEARKAIATTS